MNDGPRVLLVDDHRLLVHSLALALEAEGLAVEVADLDDRDRLIERARANPPTLVLLDLDLGGAIGNGVTLVRPFVELGASVLVVSATRERLRIASAVEQGAMGHISKAEPFEVLLKATQTAAHGGRVISDCERLELLTELRRHRDHARAEREPFEQLTEREAQVLRALADGRNVGSLAREWFVSESTVRTQVRAILSKLGVRSQLEAVALAVRTGWLASSTPSGTGLPRIPNQR